MPLEAANGVELSEASVDAELASLKLNHEYLEARVRYLEKLIDTRDSRWWKRLWFRLDGWPPWYRVGKRAWRPWHRTKVLVVISALALVLASAALARVSSGEWAVFSSAFHDPVEQQTSGGAGQPDPSLWVTNPTIGTSLPCIWDADDREELAFNGRLEEGESVSIAACIIADWREHVSWIRSETEQVSVSLQVGPVSLSGAVAACVVGPDYDASGLSLLPVEGSNGGIGIYTPVVFTVTNRAHHKLPRVRVLAGISLNPTLDPCVLGPRFGFDPAWQIGSS